MGQVGDVSVGIDSNCTVAMLSLLDLGSLRSVVAVHCILALFS